MGDIMKSRATVCFQLRRLRDLAANERSWSKEALRRFGLMLPNLISVGGKVTPDVMKGLEKAIQLKPKA
jgi:hypothetical protein